MQGVELGLQPAEFVCWCSDKDWGLIVITVSPLFYINKRGIKMSENDTATEPVDDASSVAETVDVSAYEAKIETLNATIAERDATILASAAELTASKAANYDLLMAVPGTAEVVPDEVSDESDTDISDLFGKD